MSAIVTLVAECSTSSQDSDNSKQNSNSLSVAKVPRCTVRRKRQAASRIAPITLDVSGSRSSSSSASSSRGSSRDSVRSRGYRRPEDADEENEDIKRQRLSPCEQFDSVNDLGDAERCPGSISDRECSPQADHCSLDLNGKVLYGYRFFGSGKDFYATHVETQVHKQCQIIHKEQYKQIIKIQQRLNEADKFWKFDDAEEMSNFVLPSETEVRECGQGQHILFSPWQHGSIDTAVITARGKDSMEITVRPLFKQILRGVAFCHALGIMLRDLTPRKFVFADKEKTSLRLHDVFGLYVCENVDDDTIVDHHGVPAYVAPEILRSMPVEYAGKPADIWALGVLLYFFLFKTHPFNDRPIQRVFTRIRRVSFCIPPDAVISQAVRILIFGIFKKEPSDRPTAEQLLRLRWFSDQTNAVCTPYPSVWPCMNFLAGFAGSRQSFISHNSQIAPGRPLLSQTYRHRQSRRPQDDAQVVPSGLHSPTVHGDHCNILTVNAAAAARYIERIALSLRNRRTVLSFAGPAL